MREKTMEDGKYHPFKEREWSNMREKKEVKARLAVGR